MNFAAQFILFYHLPCHWSLSSHIFPSFFQLPCTIWIILMTKTKQSAQQRIQPPNSAKDPASYRTTVCSDRHIPGIIHTDAVKSPPIILLSVLSYSGTRCVAMAKSHYLTAQCRGPKWGHSPCSVYTFNDLFIPWPSAILWLLGGASIQCKSR